jgi:SNF2 family DNA or RNA helicase
MESNDVDDNDDSDDDPGIADEHKLRVVSTTVFRQMAGHVLLIRPDIFRYLTDENMTEIDDKINNPEIVQRYEPTETSTGRCPTESNETSLDLYANDYLVALCELQRGNTCVVCEKRAEDPRWAACNHAYCHGCLLSEMHLAAAQGHITKCKFCDLRAGRCVEEDEHEKHTKLRWLNKNGKVIPSTKSSAVIRQLKAWRDPETGDPQAKTVVFTTFKDSHKLLAASLKEERWTFTTLTADLSPKERNENVIRFKNDPKICILLATSGIGGTGLNLMNAR